jgi:hypothetical protein
MFIPRLAILATLSIPLIAGGIQVSLGNPEAANDPAAQGALVTVRLSSHGQPVDNGLLQATAEGLMGDKRVSQPVTLVPLKNSRLLAIHWTRPAEGTWVLRFGFNGNASYLHVPVESTVIRAQTLDFRYAEKSTDAVLAGLAKDRATTAAKR